MGLSAISRQILSKKKEAFERFPGWAYEEGRGIVEAFGGIWDGIVEQSVWDPTLGPVEGGAAKLITMVDLRRRSPVALWPGICPLCPH